MLKHLLSISVIAFVCAFSLTELSAQIKSAEHKVVVVEKVVDDNGNVTERKVVKTGEEAKAYIQKMKEQGDLGDGMPGTDGDKMTKVEKKQYKLRVKDGNGEEKEMIWNGEGEMPEEMKGLMETHDIDVDSSMPNESTEKGKVIIIRKDTEDGEEKKMEFNYDGGELPDDVKKMLEKEGIDINEFIDEDGMRQIKVDVKDNSAKKKKGQLGVGIEDHPQGVYISNVIKESSADESGILKGDIITSVDGTKTMVTKELVEKISSYEAGDKVDVSIIRNGQEVKKSIVLKEKIEPFPFKTWDEVMKNGKEKNIEIEIEHEVIKEKK